jgi:hypothetical protein
MLLKSVEKASNKEAVIMGKNRPEKLDFLTILNQLCIIVKPLFKLRQ